MAKSMGLISESEFGGIRAKNFAVLMFADRPEVFIKGAHLETIRETEDGTDKMESKIFDGPIWIQAKQVSKYFEHKIIYNWPLSAFEELATNCILHKEYSEPYYVGIYVYPDRITFINHNRPVPSVTIEDLNLKTSFDDRKYINEEYRAIHDKEIGNKTSGGQLNLENEPQNEPQNINDKVTNRKKEIIKLITKDNSISKEMMAKHIGCSLSTIKRDLKELQKEGIIVSKNIRTGEKWTLKS